MDEITKARLLSIFEDIYQTSMEVTTASSIADQEYLLSRIETFALKGKELVEIN
jgi:hypothetical protein